MYAYVCQNSKMGSGGAVRIPKAILETASIDLLGNCFSLALRENFLQDKAKEERNTLCIPDDDNTVLRKIIRKDNRKGSFRGGLINENDNAGILADKNDITIRKTAKNIRIGMNFPRAMAAFTKPRNRYRRSCQERGVLMAHLLHQGDIVFMDFDPQTVHEHAGLRPAPVISNNSYNKYSNLAIVCPNTNTNNAFPLHVLLDTRTATTGAILPYYVNM